MIELVRMDTNKSVNNYTSPKSPVNNNLVMIVELANE